MAIALIAGNAVGAEADAAATTLAAAPFTNNITAGNCLIASAKWDSDGTTDDATITDSAGNTWNRVGAGPSYDAGNGVGACLYIATITLGGGTKPTVTANFFTNTGHGTPKSVAFRSITVSEFSGVATSSIVDKTGSNIQNPVANGVDSAVCPAATVTPDSDGELIIGFTCQAGGGAGDVAFLTAGTGYTELVKTQTISPAGYYYQTEYKVQSVAAAVQATWTLTGVTQEPALLNLMATFRAAAAGPVATKVGSFLTMFQ